ncbi:MAG TPA: aryl-sulfate sulfotransferase [Acidobacteriaceae bacterium]
MKNPRARIASLAFALLAALAISGCGVSQGTEPPPPTPAPTQPPPIAVNVGSVHIAPQYVALAPGQSVRFTASSSNGGALQWMVDNVAGGNASLGTVDSSGNYTAPASLPQSANFRITAALVSSPAKNYAIAVASVINFGVIYPTSNPQVDTYSIYLPVPGKVSVRFGPTTEYGRNTWQVATPTPYGGTVTIEVAGMLAQTLYHMQGRVALDDGATFTDVDHDTFGSGLPLKTGTPPTTSPVQITSSGNPSPGIEMWNTILPDTLTEAFATDLKGNVLWTYTYEGSTLDTIQGIQLLPDGNMLMTISYLSSLTASAAGTEPNTINVVREVDLAGTTIREISMDTLNKALAANGFKDSDGSPYQLKSFHHWVLPLPNGHWVLLAAYPKTLANLSGESGSVGVLGDVLVDVDQNMNPDWVWSSFDHLDINRRPMNFPDWTHSNDLLYSADDHNILLSMRHQNWVIKIDFNDGQGTGKVLWRLGEGGDFKLIGGTDPTDWFYAQHGLSWFTPNTTGIFKLGIMDNGNDRIFPPPTGQVLCKPLAPTSAQCYSTMDVLEINETDMTATLVTHYVPPPSDFSFFGGETEQLANGDIHVDFCAPLPGTMVQELDPTASQVIWQGTTAKVNQFRVDRLPSLYPGVQW